MSQETLIYFACDSDNTYSNPRKIYDSSDIKKRTNAGVTRVFVSYKLFKTFMPVNQQIHSMSELRAGCDPQHNLSSLLVGFS